MLCSKLALDPRNVRKKALNSFAPHDSFKKCEPSLPVCQAVLIFATSSNPNTLMARSRSTNFCTLPLAVIG